MDYFGNLKILKVYGVLIKFQLPESARVSNDWSSSLLYAKTRQTESVEHSRDTAGRNHLATFSQPSLPIFQ